MSESHKGSDDLQIHSSKKKLLCVSVGNENTLNGIPRASSGWTSLHLHIQMQIRRSSPKCLGVSTRRGAAKIGKRLLFFLGGVPNYIGRTGQDRSRNVATGTRTFCRIQNGFMATTVKTRRGAVGTERT